MMGYLPMRSGIAGGWELVVAELPSRLGPVPGAAITGSRIRIARAPICDLHPGTPGAGPADPRYLRPEVIEGRLRELDHSPVALQLGAGSLAQAPAALQRHAHAGGQVPQL